MEGVFTNILQGNNVLKIYEKVYKHILKIQYILNMFF